VVRGNFVQSLLTSNGASRAPYFEGYAFFGGALHHSSISWPDLNALWPEIDEACGVFVAMVEEADGTRIFTDPLGQFPVFYSVEHGVVGTDLFEVRQALGNPELNEDCVYDYLSYFSPMNQETLVAGVKRLRPYETLVWSGGRIRLELRGRPSVDAGYEDLLEEASRRIKARASLLAEVHKPVVHLSGGLDSRLSFAAMAAVGYEGSVFSYGDGKVPDRVISHLIASRWHVPETGIKCFHHTPLTVPEHQRALRPFNGMKTLTLSNYGSGTDFSYSEVTGYFSEALLKGFGSFWAGGRLTMFDYGRKATSFDRAIFDLPEERAAKEAAGLIEIAYGNVMMANCLFYLQNRSAGHFGAHSAVNNQHLVSIDLIYDPFLLNLVQAAPYSDAEIKSGAIILDLMMAVHSTELAAFPYDKRVLPRHAAWTREVPVPSCFEPGDLPEMELPRLPVENSEPAVVKRGLALAQARQNFRWIEKRFPLLKTKAEGNRSVESQALLSLCCLIADLDTDEQVRATA
jgi:hypothetical protein